MADPDHPWLVQSGSSNAGKDLAAKVAEVVFTAQAIRRCTFQPDSLLASASAIPYPCGKRHPLWRASAQISHVYRGSLPLSEERLALFERSLTA